MARGVKGDTSVSSISFRGFQGDYSHCRVDHLLSLGCAWGAGSGHGLGPLRSGLQEGKGLGRGPGGAEASGRGQGSTGHWKRGDGMVPRDLACNRRLGDLRRIGSRGPPVRKGLSVAEIPPGLLAWGSLSPRLRAGPSRARSPGSLRRTRSGARQGAARRPGQVRAQESLAVTCSTRRRVRP